MGLIGVTALLVGCQEVPFSEVDAVGLAGSFATVLHCQK